MDFRNNCSTAVSRIGERTPPRPGIDCPPLFLATYTPGALNWPETLLLWRELAAGAQNSFLWPTPGNGWFHTLQISNDPGRIKRNEIQNPLVQIKWKIEALFNRAAPAAPEPGHENNPMSGSGWIKLLLNIGGSEDGFGHAYLACRYMLLLTRALGITERKFINQLAWGAVLHDIGKIAVPCPILKKKGPLTAAERRVIQKHPVFGHELIRGLDFLKESARIVLFHHEKYDGSGYPFGLKENEIPWEARIFAVADALDAIISNRNYCRGRSLAAAVREVEKGRSTHFDPRVVDAFLTIPLDDWRRVRFDSGWPARSKAVH